MTRAWTCCDGNTGKKTGRGEPSIYLFHTLGLFPFSISFILFPKCRSWFCCLFVFFFTFTITKQYYWISRWYSLVFTGNEVSALELDSNGVGMLSGEAGIIPKLKQIHKVSLSHLIFCVETKRFNINEWLNKSRHNVACVSLGAVLYFDWPNQRSLGAMENLYRSVYKWEIFLTRYSGNYVLSIWELV